ncbi:DUF4376 domain-containing protein [Marinomonas ostreistagni]|uniref:DUF4376 domain-containing protein n=1 Tax=Marinomonas ostreistagni TaxID=359209 RepID=A0ABS0ZAP2_9GAMM|nr:DUF4376 domain-containing protein [Marinomonas ostreistagni]MBJ7550736.1 DUF4376 domain-containing protein [Marinomonas ostreistagni]
MLLYKVKISHLTNGDIEYEHNIDGLDIVAYGDLYVLVRSAKIVGELVLDEELAIADSAVKSATNANSLRAALLEKLALIRYRKETAGIELAGVPINTAINDQNRISNAYSSLLNGLISSTRFKGANGWQTVTAETFAPIATAVAQHVDKLFNAEGIVSEQLENMTFDELQNVDIEQLFNVAVASLEQEAA